MTGALDRIADAKKPRERRLRIVLDDEAAAALDAAESAVQTAEFTTRLDNPPDDADETLADARAALVDAEAAADACAVTFVFVAVPPDEWKQLMLRHEPSAKQIADARKKNQWLAFNPETFPAAAIAASGHVLEDDGTLTAIPHDTAVAWHKDPSWSTGDLGALFDAAQSVNLTTTLADVGKGSGSTRH